MKPYKNLEHATRALAVDHDIKVAKMLIEACENPAFKNPMNEKNYSPGWLRHHIYTEPKLKAFKMLLSVFPPLNDFKVEGFDYEFIAE